MTCQWTLVSMQAHLKCMQTKLAHDRQRACLLNRCYMSPALHDFMASAYCVTCFETQVRNMKERREGGGGGGDDAMHELTQLLHELLVLVELFEVLNAHVLDTELVRLINVLDVTKHAHLHILAR